MRLDRTITLDAPAGRVWQILADFGAIDRWSPVINHSASVDGPTSGVGATRACEVAGIFPNVVERATEWDEGRSLTFEIEGAPMMRSVNSTWSAEPDGGRTVVTARVDARRSPGPIGALMAATMMKATMGRNVGQSLRGLKHHVEAGEVAGTKAPAAGHAAERAEAEQAPSD